ncbi:MAG: diaminopimelate epimerase [Elusimicrobia bacterium GWC2_61_19]|nr:MAG: diaminopimelate epimerase [Elusimicrobia bacterium GWC2_61_19]
MGKMKFWKMSGAGNDFVLITGGRYKTAALKKLAVGLCAARTGVGADGLLYVRPGRGAVSLRYFNSDGSEAFCGNGSRCAAWWAYSAGLVKRKKFLLKTVSGELPVEITGPESVRMRMPDVDGVALGYGGAWSKPVKRVHLLDTGVPHAVVPVDDLGGLDVMGLGKLLRFHKDFGPEGVNVDFVAVRGGKVHVRTYERGVEGETPACGTGITASAVALGLSLGLRSPVELISRSGEKFRVWFRAAGAGARDIYIQGPARIVFEGEIKC